MEQIGAIYTDIGPDCMMPQFMNFNYLQYKDQARKITAGKSSQDPKDHQTDY